MPQNNFFEVTIPSKNLKCFVSSYFNEVIHEHVAAIWEELYPQEQTPQSLIFGAKVINAAEYMLNLLKFNFDEEGKLKKPEK